MVNDGSKIQPDRQPHPGSLHPTWLAFFRFCAELKFGEIERLSIQDGLPVLAEMTKKKVKFTSG
jgi:hypothetical protein